jgi:polysaccharide export outer membrane protein
MSEIIRSGGVGRCALALVVLIGSLGVCLGQQDAAKQDPPKEAATPPAVAAQETPATPAPAAAGSAQAPAQAPVPTPAASQPTAKGKASSKKGKASNSAGTGQVTNMGIQEKPYEIGPEDVLYLNVLHQADVSQTLEVRPDGYVSVRFAGEIKAAGLTSPQLADQIAEKLKTYFNNPEVNIQVVKINSKKYYISGEVRRGGVFPLTSPKTVYEALIEAGGLADFAKKTKIYVLRGEQKILFNFKEVSKGNHLQQNILLQNGDVIVVP